MRLLFAAHGDRHATRFVPAARLLHDAAARLDDVDLAVDLALDGAADRAERIHVFDFGLGPELGGAREANRYVGIAAQRAFFHLDVADAELQQRALEGFEERDGVLRAVDLGLGDALHQRHARAVEIHQRIGAARDASVAGTGVSRLAGILFEMDALERAAAHRSVFTPVRHRAALRERHVVLRDLIIFGHIRIEIILAIELRERRNLRAEREARADHVLDGRAVGYRERARQRQADGTDLGVRLAAELVDAAAEHLGRRAQLDVALDADDRFVLGSQGG